MGDSSKEENQKTMTLRPCARRTFLYPSYDKYPPFNIIVEEELYSAMKSIKTRARG